MLVCIGQEFTYVLLCCSSLSHTSVLSLQLAALLSRLSHLECVCACVCVLVCAQPCSLQSKSQLLGILSACLRGSGVALAASQGSVSFSKRCLYVHPPYHSNTPPPPGSACRGSPWYAQLARSNTRALSKIHF